MHIPDGYLGPTTCGFFYAVMISIWALASRIARKTLSSRQVPLMAIGAAFSFVIMMFNVPISGGSTGHAVGGVLVAILLGPWSACIAITAALIVHALLFGDGGITAIGANCFNMAFAMPFAGYYIYRVLSYGSSVTSKRRVLAAGIAAYLGRFQNSSQKCPKINFRTIHGDSSERKNYAALRRILKASLFVYDHDYFCMAMRD